MKGCIEKSTSYLREALDNQIERDCAERTESYECCEGVVLGGFYEIHRLR